MIQIESIADLELLQETVDLECKLAAGRDGKGALPEDFWPTYSAFANTNGGLVILGIRQQQKAFIVEGVADTAKIRQELFTGLNNRQKVSVNLLTDAQVQERSLEGKKVLLIQIPRESRTQRPVYLSNNPLGRHTFRRQNDGDHVLPDEEVKRLLAEQVEESRDTRILSGYDLDMTTFRAYRRVFSSRDPNHPWNSDNDRKFLRQIGGWQVDRETGRGGLTLAGLLMFGQMASIQEVLPNYMLDYQERPEAKTENRWIDRITLDGKWSGNLYDFFRKVYSKLTADLKVPFRLEKGEQAGTGIPKILHGWKSQHWCLPKLSEKVDPYSQTLLELRMIDLFPKEVIFRLKEKFGSRFEKLDEAERVALALAASEGTVNHARLKTLTAEHPVDLTRLLQRLTQQGMMESTGGRGAVYHLAGEPILTPDDVFGPSSRIPESSSPDLEVNSPDLEVNSPDLEVSSPDLEVSSPDLVASFPDLNGKRDENGCLISHQLPLPVIEDLRCLTSEFRSRLEGLAAEPRMKRKVSHGVMKSVILRLCADHFVTLRCLAALVQRKPESLREQYLRQLVHERKLILAFPANPTDQRQAYRTNPGNMV